MIITRTGKEMYTNSWDKYSKWMRLGIMCRGLKSFHRRRVGVSYYHFIGGWSRHRDIEYLKRVRIEKTKPVEIDNLRLDLSVGEIGALENAGLEFKKCDKYNAVVKLPILQELGS